jgi:hypothetical protein
MVFMMERLVKLLIFFILLENCQGVPLLPYEKYVDEIINSFTKDMRKEYGLVCVGSGGRMACGVETIKILFYAYRKATIEEARELMVKTKEKLVEKVNAHKKIRPFLIEDPFTWHGADIYIAFHKPCSTSYYLDGSVAIACSADWGKKISYDAAELQKIMNPPLIDTEGHIVFPAKCVEDEVFIPLLTEPYEEAVRIVHENSKKL